MSSNDKVKQLLLSKLESWSKFEEENIYECISLECHIAIEIVEDIGKELIEELKTKAEILADLHTNGDKVNSNNV